MGRELRVASIQMDCAPPQPPYPQPPMSPVDDPFYEHMVPLYRKGVRRRWGAEGDQQ